MERICLPLSRGEKILRAWTALANCHCLSNVVATRAHVNFGLHVYVMRSRHNGKDVQCRKFISNNIPSCQTIDPSVSYIAAFFCSCRKSAVSRCIVTILYVYKLSVVDFIFAIQCLFAEIWCACCVLLGFVDLVESGRPAIRLRRRNGILLKFYSSICTYDLAARFF
jgi:hypothetical protein